MNTDRSTPGSFDLLTPQLASGAVEQAYGLRLDGTVTPYPSYVNRVYGVRDEDGQEYITKFYRPDRWSFEAIAEEHAFLLQCREKELPVIAPLPDADGDTLLELEIDREPHRDPLNICFALFPKTGGRNFDPESDEDWFRIGAVVGRLHQIGSQADAEHRTHCTPDEVIGAALAELTEAQVVHPEFAEDFADLCEQVRKAIQPLFAGLPLQRVHGDCHRGNILDRPDTGLLLIDFDDMMLAPPVQDLWLLLPGFAEDCGRELTMILDGYEQFCNFDRSTLELIEPLRFMRMVYFLAWRARQRNDYWFQQSFPDWGTKAFWSKELEDLMQQRTMLSHTSSQ